jgi:tripartite-type tricarboxylate transporter receptor subunit TctC
MIESGFSDFVSDSWTGIAVLAGTSRAIIGTLNAAINSALKSPEVTASAGSRPKPGTGTPQDFGAFLAEERRRWADFARVSGVEPE